jgi:ADP-ribose pyrophosphatase
MKLPGGGLSLARILFGTGRSHLVNHTSLGEELVYHGRVFDLVRAKLRLPNGKEHTYDLVKHAGAVVILPLDDAGNIHFVRQYRVGAQATLLELPAGLLEEGETPEVCAHREVQEETGMAAQTLQKLGAFYMVPGYSTEKLHVYLATGLSASRLPGDEDEFIEDVSLPVAEVLAMAKSGQIQDGKTLAVLLLAQEHLRQFTGESQ